MSSPAQNEYQIEYSPEKMRDMHERILRRLIIHGFAPIYIGDAVAINDRWIGGQDPLTKERGTVTSLDIGIQGVFNIDYTIVGFQNEKGESKETYFYCLDRVNQTPSNALLEQILREPKLDHHSQ